ncbi:hypothetical protein NYE69_19440 [Paenibacillus sp. FSL R5-0527]|uniref:hypothetical protein n=1 Tax=Paenibacillus sp. FSL R5-0527 TaxID=2975321 RepID=UPI0026871848
MLTITRKAVSLLVVLAVMITGFLPQTAGATEMDADSASLAQTAGAPATIQNYPMPSIYTASSVFTLKADNETIPVIKYLDDYDYAQFSFSGTVRIEVTANAPSCSGCPALARASNRGRC